MTCVGDEQCFDNHTCVDGACVWAADCALDEANDTAEGAQLLALGYWSGHGICGREDEDWFRVLQPALQGRRVVVRSDPRDVSVYATIGGTVVGVGALRAPGLTVLDVPAAIEPRALLLNVSGRDTSGAYLIGVEATAGACAGDMFDLFGDDAPAIAPVVGGDYRAVRRACPGDLDLVSVSVEAEDRLDVRATFGRLADVARPASRAPADLDLWVADGAGAPLVRGVSTSSTHEHARTDPALAEARWTVAVEPSQAPVDGEAYAVRVFRELGRRRAACEAAPMGTALDLEPRRDLADVGCGLHAPDGRPDAVMVVHPPHAGAVLHLTSVVDTGPSATIAVGTDCMGKQAVDRCALGGQRRGWTALEWVAPSTEPAFVWVSSQEGQRVSLTALFDPDDNFTCVGKRAERIAGSGTWRDSTAGSTDTASPACRGAPISTGPDRFYRVELAAGQRAVVTLSELKGGLLWAGAGCEGVGRSCSTWARVGPRGEPASLVLTASVAMEATVVVDGATRDIAGDYRLDVRLD